nr:hypothetical protein [Micromonospora sp. DSM 115978]
LNRLLDGEVDRIGELPGEPLDKLLAALDSVERRRSLHPCVAERAPHAPPVMEYHERLHDWLHGLALDAVTELLPEAEREISADAVVATIEGGLANPAPSRPTSHLVRYLLDAFSRQPCH